MMFMFDIYIYIYTLYDVWSVLPGDADYANIQRYNDVLYMIYIMICWKEIEQPVNKWTNIFSTHIYIQRFYHFKSIKFHSLNIEHYKKMGSLIL